MHDDRERFLEERRSGIGGSDAAAILGVSPRMSPLKLFLVKTGQVQEPDKSELEHLWWGQKLEPVIAERYVMETARCIETRARETLRRPDKPYLLGHRDYAILSAEDMPGQGTLEIKNTSSFMKKEWYTEDGIVDPPVYYQVQLQHYLMVDPERPAWGSLAALIGGNHLEWFDQARNDAFIAQLEARCDEFWDRVQRDDPPEPMGSAADTEALSMLYPKAQGESAIVLPPESLRWHEQRQAACGRIEDAKQEKELATQQLKALMGEAAFGLLPGQAGRYSWRNIEKKAYSVQATSYREFRFREK